MFDYQLKQIALSLRDHAATALAVAGAAQDSAEQEVVIQIWDYTGLHLYRSHAGMPLLPQTPLGLSTMTTSHSAWRVFNLLVYHDHIIQVAQPLRVRQAMATSMAARTLLPWLATMPLLGGMIWWLVGRDLKPLIDVARAVRQRHPTALEPLPSAGLAGTWLARTLQSLGPVLRHLAVSGLAAAEGRLPSPDEIEAAAKPANQ